MGSFNLEREGDDDSPIQPRSPPISLLGLRELRLYGAKIPTGFSPSLHLPSLEHLEATGYGFTHPNTNNGLLELLKATCRQIKIAWIGYGGLTPAELEASLQLLPNVRELTMSSKAHILWETMPGTHPPTPFTPGLL